MPPPRRPHGWLTTATRSAWRYGWRVTRLEYTRLHDSLLAGRMPVSARDIETLRDEGVTVVVNLCEDQEYWDGERDAVAAACAQAGIAELRIPVIDGGTVPGDVLDEAVAAASDGVVYVHCRGGRERSAAVTIAVLAAASGSSVDEALELAVSRRPGFRPLPWQVEGVRSWLHERGGRRILDA
jgi:atypical dual specificity phosphatase